MKTPVANIFLPFILMIPLASCCMFSQSSAPEVSPPWIQANPGLKNQDGTDHVIPGPAVTTGKTIDVTRAPYNCSVADSMAERGGDDRPGIEAAMNAASPGDELYFPDGTYNLKTAWSTDPKSNIRLKSGVNLRGESRERVLFKTSFDDAYTSTKPAGSNSYYVLRGYNVQDIHLEKFTVTSQWNGTSSTDTENNNTSHGGPNRCIDISGSSIYIENIIVEKFLNIGINAGPGSHDVVIARCLARNATDVGAGGCGYGFQFAGKFIENGLETNPNLGTAFDNYFNMMDELSTEGNYIRHAALIQYWAHNNLVKNCAFTGCLLDAIDLHGEDEYNNEVTLNTLTDSVKGAGVGLGNSGGSSVIHDKTGPHNYIHDNTIIDCKKGITVQYNTAYTRIEGNVIEGCTKSSGRGIAIGNASYTMLADNMIKNNDGTSFYGIHLYAENAMGLESAGVPFHTIIKGNSITNNSSGTAFKIEAGTDTIFEGNIASGNTNNEVPQ